MRERFNKRLKRNIAYQYAMQAAIYLYPFVTLPYLTRVLDPDVFAIRAFSISIMTVIGSLISYGFNDLGTKVIAENPNDKKAIGQLMTRIALLRLGLCLVGGIIVWVASLFIPIMAENLPYMLIAYLGICLTGMLPDFIFQGLQDMAVMTKRFVSSKTVAIVLIFVFVKEPQDILLVATFESASSLIAFAWSWLDVLLKRKIHFTTEGLSFAGIRKCFARGTIYFTSSFSDTTLNAFTMAMIGLLITNDAQISFWSLSISLIGGIQALYYPFANSLYPHVVASHDLQAVKKTLVIGTPLAALATVILFVFADAAMLVLGGPEYVEGAHVLRCLSPVILFSFPVIMLGYPVLGATGHIKRLTLSSVASATVNIVGLLVLPAFNAFSIITVAIVRSAAELALLALRAAFAWPLRNEHIEAEDESAT